MSLPTWKFSPGHWSALTQVLIPTSSGDNQEGWSALTNMSAIIKDPWLLWLSRFECPPINQKIIGSIPNQDTCLGCRFRPQSVCIWETTDQCFSLMLMFLSLCLSFFLSLPPSPSLSLKTLGMSSGDDLKKIIIKESFWQASKEHRSTAFGCCPTADSQSSHRSWQHA